MQNVVVIPGTETWQPFCVYTLGLGDLSKLSPGEVARINQSELSFHHSTAILEM